MLEYGLVQMGDLREPEKPNAQRVRVVTVEIVRQIRVVAGAIDHVVDALVEFHQRRTMLFEATRFECRQIPQELINFGKVILV